jgi:hypothetical protein
MTYPCHLCLGDEPLILSDALEGKNITIGFGELSQDGILFARDAQIFPKTLQGIVKLFERVGSGLYLLLDGHELVISDPARCRVGVPLSAFGYAPETRVAACVKAVLQPLVTKRTAW